MSMPFDYSLFDLEPRDLKIYETMLASPEASSIRTIAASTNMNRGTTFEVIKKLVRLGLVAGYYKSSRKYYRAEPPEALTKLSRERQTAVQSELANVERYARELKSRQVVEPHQQFGRHYEGEEEIAVLLQDVLQTVAALPDKTYRSVSSAEVSSHMYKKFRNFTRQRVKQGIHVDVIAVGGGGELAELSQRKILTTDRIPAGYVIIYGDKVAQITLTSLGNIQGSIIEDAGVAALQRLLFDKLWQTL